MENFIVSTFPPTILNHVEDLNVSLYMPTHRTSTDTKQDILRFRNLVDSIESKLPKDGPIIKKLRALEKEPNFWLHGVDGIAILANKEHMNILRLPRSVDEWAYVGNEFQIRPLIRTYQSNHQYLAVGVSKKDFVVYRGNRYGFTEFQLPEDVKTNVKDVLGEDFTQKRLKVIGQGSAHGVYYGQGSRSDEENIDRVRFFQYINGVTESLSLKYRMPLILITLPEHQGLFRQISQNPYLLEQGVNKSYESLDYKTLHHDLWEVLEPIYEDKTRILVDRYHEGKSRDMATDALQEIFTGLHANRIHQLVIENDKKIFGTTDENGIVTLSEDGEELLNSAAKLALAGGVEVVILPKEKMPTHHGAFAIYRY